MTVKRIHYIDFLKFIGLSGIIVAHTNAPNWLMMFRSFDVPLLIIISSILAKSSIKKYGHDKNSIIKYLISRIKRLVFPTWIFLTIYFILKVIFTKQLISSKYYLESFLLTRYGIGYVWIILIYLYSAILIPIFRKIGYSKRSTIIIVLIYILYEILYYFKIGTSSKIIDSTLYYIIPYGLLTYLGYNFDQIDIKRKKIYTAISLFLFASLMYYYYTKTGDIELVSIVKYPPRLYYLAYGIFCSIILLTLTKKHDNNLFKNKIIIFISQHSMWIYLWHILWKTIYNHLKMPKIWLIEFLLIYILSITTVIIINKLLDAIEQKHSLKLLKYLRG